MKSTHVLILVGVLLMAGCATRKTEKPPSAADFQLGSHHLKVTSFKEAQRAFDRGLAWMYSFGYHAAEQEFRRATELDPNCAMAWWGIAMANGPHINFPMVPPDRAKTAWDAISKARELAPRAAELEQHLIAAAAKRYAMPQPEDRSGLDRAYADAMREVWQKHQTDDDVGALFAEAMMDLRPWDLWEADGAPRPGTPEIVEALERVLWLNPKHPGANHYYIHVMEASPQPEKALSSARRLERAVPGSGHMVHMPSHIYARVGDWNAAAESNVAAMRADTLYRAVYPQPGFYALYMAHNGHFLAWTAMMEGRSAFALGHARGIIEAVPAEFMRDMGPVVDGYLAFVPEVLMRFGKWEEILKEPRPPGNLPYSTAMWRYARAAALAALDRVQEARAEQNLSKTRRRKFRAMRRSEIIPARTF